MVPFWVNIYKRPNWRKLSLPLTARNRPNISTRKSCCLLFMPDILKRMFFT